MVFVNFECDKCGLGGEIPCNVEKENVDLDQICILLSRYHIQEKPTCDGEIEVDFQPEKSVCAEFCCDECGFGGEVLYIGTITNLNPQTIYTQVTQAHFLESASCSGNLRLTILVDFWVKIDPDIIYNYELNMWINN